MSDPHIMNGGDFSLNSYVGHEFEVREMPSSRTGLCVSEDQTCRNGFFVVSENEEQSECDVVLCCLVMCCAVLRIFPTTKI